MANQNQPTEISGKIVNLGESIKAVSRIKKEEISPLLRTLEQALNVATLPVTVPLEFIKQQRAKKKNAEDTAKKLYFSPDLKEKGMAAFEDALTDFAILTEKPRSAKEAFAKLQDLRHFAASAYKLWPLLTENTYVKVSEDEQKKSGPTAVTRLLGLTETYKRIAVRAANETPDHAAKIASGELVSFDTLKATKSSGLIIIDTSRRRA